MAGPEALEARLGHAFSDRALLAQALTHRSHGRAHNERLEFLGDAVLDCVVSEALYTRFPDAPEGALTRLLGSLVRAEALAALAGELGLEAHLRFDRRPAGSGLDAPPPNMMADALEALFGAIFLDGGYDAARAAILKAYAARLRDIDPGQVTKDAKSQLQELLHARRKKLPEYHIVSEEHAPQRNRFEVECVVEALGVRATGTGSSRQRAEQQAAQAVLEKLGR